MFRLAHLSDIHLAPLPRPRVSELCSKRVLGYLNWRRGRNRIHVREIADAMAEDIKTINPDHVAITGDLVNISLIEEFCEAKAWLTSFGGANWISVIPGNHDAYVRVPWKAALGLWGDYMTSGQDAHKFVTHSEPFPYVRLMGSVALIAVSSGVPTPWFMASGHLGRQQIATLTNMLAELREAGYFRVLLIHHPPLVGQARWRKALRDANELEDGLRREGCELVLHGHNHKDMSATLQTAQGGAHVFGVPSASASAGGDHPVAQYNLYEIDGDSDSWRLKVIKRRYHEADGCFKEVERIDVN